MPLKKSVHVGYSMLSVHTCQINQDDIVYNLDTFSQNKKTAENQLLNDNIMFFN